MLAKPPEYLVIDRLETPIGGALLAVDEDGYLRALDWEDYGERQTRLLARFAGGAPSRPGTAPAAIRQAIDAYFDGEFKALEADSLAHGRYIFSVEVLGSPSCDPRGEHLQLRSAGDQDRQACGHARRWPGQRVQSGRRGRPLPPGDWGQRIDNRIRWRPVAQALASAP